MDDEIARSIIRNVTFATDEGGSMDAGIMLKNQENWLLEDITARGNVRQPIVIEGGRRNVVRNLQVFLR